MMSNVYIGESSNCQHVSRRKLIETCRGACRQMEENGPVCSYLAVSLQRHAMTTQNLC